LKIVDKQTQIIQIKKSKIVLRTATKWGLVPKNILQNNFDYSLKVFKISASLRILNRLLTFYIFLTQATSREDWLAKLRLVWPV